MNIIEFSTKKTCSVDGCGNKHYAIGFCIKHRAKFKKYGNPLAGKEHTSPRGFGYIDHKGYRMVRFNGKNVREHILIAEKALGRKLPKLAAVHHVNYIKHDNRPSNLVICPSNEYHQLLHVRSNAFEQCGNPSWRKCNHCGKYDAIDNLYISGNSISHRDCLNSYARKRRAEKRDTR